MTYGTARTYSILYTIVGLFLFVGFPVYADNITKRYTCDEFNFINGAQCQLTQLDVTPTGSEASDNAGPNFPLTEGAWYLSTYVAGDSGGAVDFSCNSAAGSCTTYEVAGNSSVQGAEIDVTGGDGGGLTVSNAGGDASPYLLVYNLCISNYIDPLYGLSGCDSPPDPAPTPTDSTTTALTMLASSSVMWITQQSVFNSFILFVISAGIVIWIFKTLMW